MPVSMPIPMLASDRLTLVPISRAHRADIYVEFTPAITTYMLPRPAADISETDAFIDRAVADMAAGDELQWVMIDRTDGAFIGCIGLHRIRRVDPELGLWVKASAHGRGLGLEAASTAIQWAREHLKITHLRYPVDRRNLASRRIPERHGGVVQREFQTTGLGGNALDSVEYWIPASPATLTPPGTAPDPPSPG